MKDKQYFPVPLAHVTSPFVPPPPVEPAGAAPAGTAVAEEESSEPWGMLDAEEPPELYGVDEVTVLARDPYTLFAHWEITPATLAEARTRLGEDGTLVLRLVTAAGPVIDETLQRPAGRGYLPAPFPGASLFPTLGLRGAAGAFEPISSAPRVRVPWSQPEEGDVEWVEVAPTIRRGAEREPPTLVRRALPAESPLRTDDLHTPALWPDAPDEDDATNFPRPTSPAGGEPA